MDDRLGDKLHQWNARTVVIDERRATLVACAERFILSFVEGSRSVYRARGVFLEMHASYADTRELPARGERVLVLRELVPFWKVGVEIVLAIEFRIIGELGTECHSHPQHVPDSLVIHNRQCPRMCHAYGADVHIRLCGKRVIARVA